MIVVDANILFPLFVDVDPSPQVHALFDFDRQWRTEPFALIELSNILATYERLGLLTKRAVHEALESATEFLTPNLVAVSNDEALEIAMEHKISGYDARYITVAQKLEQLLVTQDKRLRKAVPDRTISLADAINE